MLTPLLHQQGTNSLMLLNYLHGEGIVFSSLVHAFFVIGGTAALLFGLLKYKSLIGGAITTMYIAATLLVVSLSEKSFLLETTAGVLTLPWNLVIPCYNLDTTCTLTAGVAFICAVLNAAIFYFVIAWFSRLK